MLIIIPLRLPQRGRCIDRNGTRSSITCRRHGPSWETWFNPSRRTSSDRYTPSESRKSCHIRSLVGHDTKPIVRTINIIALPINIVDLVHHKRARFGPQTKPFNGERVRENEVIANEIQRRSLSAVGDAPAQIPEGYVGECYGACVGRERVLPVLVEVQTVERGFTADVFKQDVAHRAVPSWVGFDEGDVVPLDYGDVASVLEIVNRAPFYTLRIRI